MTAYVFNAAASPRGITGQTSAIRAFMAESMPGRWFRPYCQSATLIAKDGLQSQYRLRSFAVYHSTYATRSSLSGTFASS